MGVRLTKWLSLYGIMGGSKVADVIRMSCQPALEWQVAMEVERYSYLAAADSLMHFLAKQETLHRWRALRSYASKMFKSLAADFGRMGFADGVDLCNSSLQWTEAEQEDQTECSRLISQWANLEKRSKNAFDEIEASFSRANA
jgi:hypothetical protein